MLTKWAYKVVVFEKKLQMVRKIFLIYERNQLIKTTFAQLQQVSRGPLMLSFAKKNSYL